MACHLCDLPTPSPPVTDETLAGEYCCRGCLEVARTLGEAGEPPSDLTGGSIDTGPDEAVDGTTTFFAVDGMHCTTCERFLEKTTSEQHGVLAASANYPAGLLKVTYDPERVTPADLTTNLSGLGYAVRDAEGTRAKQESIGRLLVGGFLGMMAMMWYGLFLYPTYLGIASSRLVLDVNGPAGLYVLGNLWVLATVVLGYTGYPILRGAYVSLRAHQPNMDLLIAIAAVTAYGYSAIRVMTGGTEVYFDITIVIILVVSLGNSYEDRLTARATSRLTDLTEERVTEARKRGQAGTQLVRVAELAAGHEIIVKPGERIPIDGTIVTGEAGIDESLITGESTPNRKQPGDSVLGGTLVTDGTVVVEVGEAAESTADRLASLLWEARSTQPGAQRLADRLAAVFVPVVILLAVGAVVWHLASGATPTGALLTGLTVLVVSCPCALGLATPLAVAAGVSGALDRGIIIADGSLFEAAPASEVIALDKTGTLSAGEMTVVSVDGPPAVLERAAAVEELSNHPVAEAVTRFAEPVDLPVTDFETAPGRGVSAIVDGDHIIVGCEELFREYDWEISDSLATDVREARRDGQVPTLVGWEGQAQGLIITADRPRPEWQQAVEELATDRDVVVITGDSQSAVEPFRDHPGITEVFAEVRPEAKAAVVEQLRQTGSVAMVGDGSNDAPALATADMGIALDSGTALAADAADAIVTHSDLRAVATTFDLTAATNRRIRENIGWAFLYNALAIPLAIAGLLNPLFAAVAMASSSVLVVGNSVRPLIAEDDTRDSRPPQHRLVSKPAASDG